MQCEIGVIGNGMVGKVAALGFAQAGLQVTLLCPSESSMNARKMMPEWDTRVFALNYTAKNLLSKLKVWDALDLQRVAPIESMSVVDAEVVDGAALSLDAYLARQSELAWIVEDQNLNQALDSALRFASNVKMIAGQSVVMSTDFSELILDHDRILRAELWIGADGAHSWLRNQANIGVDYRSYEQRGVVMNFSCSKPHHGVAYQWFVGEQGIIALLPLPGNQVSLVWSAPNTLANLLLEESPDQLAQRLMPYCANPLGELAPLSGQRMQSFPLRLMRPHSVIGPRLALVGDAAHAVHPLSGHGLNLGFGDVEALLEVIGQREAWRALGDERVLERYARARKEDVFLMQLLTDGLTRLFHSQLAPIQTVRNMGMRIVNTLPFLKRQLMQRAMNH